MNYKKIEKQVLQMLKEGLNPNLYYHGVHHTLEVIENVELIAQKENISKENIQLLKLAALMHDIGFVSEYVGHEEAGCQISRDYLPQFKISEEAIDQICGMIMATKIPQNPKNQLESILADADLLYLGTDSFMNIGNTLFEELKANHKIKSEKEWNQIQANFLSNHTYHTDYCINKFTAKKTENFKLVTDWLSKN
ncbi:MAG: HD domain-containing protein [Bacteroidota bacterium]